MDRECNVVITNYESVSFLSDSCYVKFDIVIIDEVVEYRHFRTSKYRSILQYCSTADMVVAMSSEGIENGLEDIWSQYYLLDYGDRLYPDYAQFTEKFFFRVPINKGRRYKLIPKNNTFEEIISRVKDITFFEESIPPGTNSISVRRVVMNGTEYTKYKWLAEKLKTKTGISRNSLDITTKMMKLANGIFVSDEGERLVLHKQKIEAVRDIMKENPHKRIVISYWFDTDFDILKRTVGTGAVLSNQQSIDKWNSSDEHLAYINPYFKADTHVNTDILIWYSLTWNWYYFSHINRMISSELECKNIILIFCDKTIDDVILKNIGDKQKTYEYIFTNTEESVNERAES